MAKSFAITSANIGVGPACLNDHAVLVDKGTIIDVCPSTDIPAGVHNIQMMGGVLVPGVIDLQVNAGGGVQFNNDTSVEAIETICKAHTRLGTCQLLVTLRQQFELDGRTIMRRNGRLELADGTLAGADTDMLSSVRYLVNEVGVDYAEAMRMATSYPSSCIGAMDYLGSLVPGHCANIVHLDKNETLRQVWVDGLTQL